MGKPLKIILSTCAVAVLLLIAAAATLPFVIDPNDFKPELAAVVKDKTGRDLALDGDLTLSLFPGAHISTGKMSLSNTPGFDGQPFATLEEGEINLLLWPLLSKKIEISRIVLKGLVVNLVRNPEGVANWGDLNRPKIAQATIPGQSDGASLPATTQAAFAIGGMAVENARINWHDQKNGQQIEFTELNLNSDAFVFNEPVGVSVSLKILDKKSQSSQTIKFNTELTANEALDKFTLRQSDLQLSVSGENIPAKAQTAALTIADVALDMTQQTAKISALLLKSGEMALSADLNGSAIKDKPSFQGAVSVAPLNLVQLMQQLDIKRPVMQDKQALNKLALNFDLAATAESAELQNLLIMLDDSQIKGSVSVRDFAQTAIRFGLAIDTLDLDRYLSPANKASKPIASPALLLAAGFSALPVATLRKLNADGVVTLGKLKVKDLILQDVQVKLNTKNGVVTSQQSIKQFYQGHYSGDLNLDKRGDKPLLAVNEKMEQVQIEPLLKDYRGKAWMSGLINASMQLQGQGQKADELKSSAKGRLNFLIKDSVIKGFNLQKLIDEGKARLKGTELAADYKQDQTLFSEMSGSASIANGMLQNDDFVGKSAKLRVDGKGNVNLISEALAYKINAQLLNADASAEEPVKGTVGIHVAGTLSKPTYRIDIASLLTEKNKAKIDKLIDKLDKKIGVEVGDLLKHFLKRKKKEE
ncbi:MAG: AsmA family protein [Methylobacter sp.]|nr:AsmA family protein [Methylobacter sp.]